MSIGETTTVSPAMIQFGSPRQFFDLSDHFVSELFIGCRHVWDPLKQLDQIAGRLVENTTVIRGTVMEGAFVASSQVFVDEGARIEPGAFVTGPCYIGPGAEVRHGAYIRGPAVLFRESVVGHTTEVKNSVFLPGAKAPHFAYVGDSILGSRVNLGAGTKLSNVAITSTKDRPTGRRKSIIIPSGNDQHDTGLGKLGSILGDDCQTGCNSVLNPGCIMEPGCLVYPNASVPRGHYSAGTIIKLRQKIVHGQRTNSNP